MHKNVLRLQPGNGMDDVTKLLLDGKIGAQRCKANKFKTNKVTTKLLIHNAQQTSFLIQKRCCKEQSNSSNKKGNKANVVHIIISMYTSRHGSTH